jgi:hypothetical protein
MWVQRSRGTQRSSGEKLGRSGAGHEVTVRIPGHVEARRSGKSGGRETCLEFAGPQLRSRGHWGWIHHRALGSILAG